MGETHTICDPYLFTVAAPMLWARKLSKLIP
jgi:hypothetical protein